MNYEFYIYTLEGTAVWQWHIHQTDKVINDIEENKDDKTFSVEVLHWLSEDDYDYIEIYPKDNSSYLPKYVQKYTDKVLEGIKNGNRNKSKN